MKTVKTIAEKNEGNVIGWIALSVPCLYMILIFLIPSIIIVITMRYTIIVEISKFFSQTP